MHDNSPNRQSILSAIAQEAAALIALALFVGMLAVWGSVLGSPK